MKNVFLLTVIALIMLSGCKKNDDSLNQPPMVQFINPLATFAITVVSIEDTLNIIALAKDNDGEVNNVQFYLNGTLLAKDKEAPWSQNILFKEEGDYVLGLTATDNNMETSDTVLNHLRVVDFNKADIDITIYPRYHKKENDPVTIIANSFSSLGKILNTKIYINDTIVAMDTVSYLEYILESASTGSYEVYAEVEDETGKLTKSRTESFFVDKNKPPQIEFSLNNSNNPIPGSTVYASAIVSDSDGEIDSVKLFLNDSLVKTTYSEYWISFSLLMTKSGDYKLNAIAWDNDGDSVVSEDLFFSVQEGLLPNGLITNIIPSTNDKEFFALNKENKKLMLLYPFEESERKIDLPYSLPIDMDYSPAEEKLFIVYENYGVVSIWDRNTEEFTTKSFSSTADAISVVADVIHRRIYVETDKGFFILNMDDGNVLNTDVTLEFDNYVIDPNKQLMFTAEYKYSLVVKKYSLINDNFDLQQTREDLGYVNSGMVLNEQKAYFLAISTTGNDGNGTHYAFKTDNIYELYGQFSNIDYPKSPAFTRDGETLILVDDFKDILYMLNTESFQVDRTIDIIDGSNALVAINNSKTKAVIFSHSTYNVDYKLLYYRLD
ncbi:MAG: hypothetical protein GXO88_11445 [Chlorobi bacterium]|nr:hypothetical protein [Chlorobiota bacterium]